VVAQGDRVEAPRSPEALQGGPTQAPRFGLQALTPAKVAPGEAAAVERDTEPIAEVPAERGVADRVGPEAVIHVGGLETGPAPGGQGGQEPQQAHRVSPARQGHEDALFQEAAAGQHPLDFLLQEH
jgi:hypothetical protein